MVSYKQEYSQQIINPAFEISPALRVAAEAMSKAALKNLVTMAEAHGEAAAVSWAMRQPGVIEERECTCDEVKAAAASEWDTTLGPFAETSFKQWVAYCAANGKPAPSVEQHVLTQAEFRTQHIAEKLCLPCIDVKNAGRPMFETWREDPLTDEEEEAEKEKEEEHEGEVPCGCEPNFWKACPHECSVCEKALTLRDGEGICVECEEDLVTVEKEWPEDAAEAKEKSIFSEGAYHALVLRIRANNCREAAHDTDDAEEVRKCLEEAKRLDARASLLLFHKADSRFKPWWFASWDYWMMPGSTHEVPAWAAPVAHLLSPEVLAAPPSVVSPCGISGHVMPIGTLFCPTCWPEPPVEDKSESCAGCTAVNGFHVGICWSAALPTQSISRLPGGFQTSAPAPAPAPEAKAKAKPDYKNKNWPSPRPKLFAKSCAPHLKFKKHQDALEFLAQRAKMTVENLLKMRPNTYILEYMGGMKNAPEYWQAEQMKMPWWHND